MIRECVCLGVPVITDQNLRDNLPRKESEYFYRATNVSQIVKQVESILQMTYYQYLDKRISIIKNALNLFSPDKFAKKLSVTSLL